LPESIDRSNDVFYQMMQQPAVQWAYDNAFDEPLFEVVLEATTQTTNYRIAMYLTPKHITFWRLRFD